MVYGDIILHPELGEIFIFWGNDGKLKEISLEGSHLDMFAVPGSFTEVMPEVSEYLQNFGNDLIPDFSPDILDFSWCSGFMEKVYRTLFTIRRGAVLTYGKLAEIAGFPRAARAVGTAMRKNRFILVIPCHRVVGANSLGGFTGSIAVKKKLLRMEGFETEW